MKVLILHQSMLVGGQLAQEDWGKISLLTYRGLRDVIGPAVFHATDELESIITLSALTRYGLGLSVLSLRAWESNEEFLHDSEPLSHVHVTKHREVKAAFERFRTKGFTLIGEERSIGPLVGILVLEERSEMLFIYPGIRLLTADDGGVTIPQD